MNFFKKMQGGSTSKKSTKKSRLSETPVLASLIEDDGVDGTLSDTDIVSRKAEFLELLAKEERAHRVKLAELRNEPIQGRRETDPLLDTLSETDAIEETKRRTPLPPVSPRFDDRADNTAPERTLSAHTDAAPLENDPSFTAKVSRPSEAQTRADIGKQIGGNDFLMGGAASFKAPELSALVTNNTPREDVTPADLARPTKANLQSTRKDKPHEEDIHMTSRPQDRQPQTSPKDPYENMDFSRPIKCGRANVSELRLDVSRIHSDIENGDALYRRAQQRVQGLIHFVEKAEVDFSLLERIEPENRRLKARNAMIGKELEDIVRKTSLLETDLDEHRRRLSEVNVQYDTVNGNLAKAMKALSERDREIRQITNDISSITLKLDREKTTTEVEVRENNVLRDRVINLTNDLEDAKSSRADTTKTVESLRIDLEDHRSARDRIETEAYDLRHALDDAQKQNIQMKGEMVALHQDISTFKTQYEFNLISRDDRITMLESQIEDLARQLQVKEDIVSSAARDVTELRKSRTGGELERERLEKVIDTQTLQLDMAQKQIMESQSAMEEMDTRYRDVAAALSITTNRRANQVPSRAPDIHPEMNAQPQAHHEQHTKSSTAPPMPKRTQISDDYGTQDTDAIEDHIMEYKLGLRNSLIPAELSAKLDEVSSYTEDTEETEQVHPRRDDNFDTLDQETIEDRIMDYKLGLRKNIF